MEVDAQVVQSEFAFLSGETLDLLEGVSRGHSSAVATTRRPEHKGRPVPLHGVASSKKPSGPEPRLSLQDKEGPHGELLEAILSRENMLRAWKRVKANRGAAGVDGMDIASFPEYARIYWPVIRESIERGTYRPQPVRHEEIPKATGGKRPLGIPTVLDRMIQQAIAQVLTPLFDPGFSEHSYGFRPGRSGHQAVRAVEQAAKEGYTIGVDADLSKFFETVNHDQLMRLLAAKVKDPRVLRLIARYLQAGIMIEGQIQATTQGVPQGGPLSPLLANIVLDPLDKELEARGHRFARYADDFIILVKSRRAAERVMESICHFIEGRLHLRLNPDKSKVAPLEQCTFLGFRIVRGKLRWSPEAEAEFKRRIRELTARNWGVSMQTRLSELAAYLRGWVNYFGISTYYTPIPALDKWLRRRVRLCYWKMWKKPRKRMAELRRLGTSRRHAVMAGRSRKGYWRLSRTLATQSGMSDAWLRSQGLLSIKELWCSIHYPASRRG